MSTQSIKERPLPCFEHRTGLDTERLLLLEREVEARIGSWQPDTGRRKTLELFDAIVICLIYLRHNTIQAALGEQSRISQATVSRYIDFLEPVISCPCLSRSTGPERSAVPAVHPFPAALPPVFRLDVSLAHRQTGHLPRSLPDQVSF